MSPKSDRAEHTAAAGSIKPDRHFLPDYYAHVPTEEVQNYSTETLRARAVHLSVASSRRPGQAAVGILNELEASIVAVVTEDLPYLVQSVMAELTREDASIRLLVHPTFQVLRDPDSHTLLDVRPGPSREGLLEESVPPARGTSETWVAMEIGKLADEAAESELTERLQRVLDDVRIVAEDAAAIHGKVSEAVTSVDGFPQAVVPPPEQLHQLLLWLDDGNFLFFGYTEYELTTAGGQELLSERQGSPLGLLRRPVGGAAGMTAPGLLRTRGCQALTVAISEIRSTVLRRSYLDELRLQVFNEAGRVTGEHGHTVGKPMERAGTGHRSSHPDT